LKAELKVGMAMLLVSGISMCHVAVAMAKALESIVISD
jgi:hypothetical protein